MNKPPTTKLVEEPPVDASRAIVDPHHHLWDHDNAPMAFLLQEFLGVIRSSGHKIVKSIYVECSSMYRHAGPVDLRPIGETEFANGMAAMSASGRYGDVRVAAGIVGTANLRLGREVVPILEAQTAAGNGRLRGIRFPVVHADTALFGRTPDPKGKGIMLDPAFRAGVRAMRRFDLSLDVWCVHTQLAELADLASACPDITIILDHIGTPLKYDAHLGRDAEIFPQWKAAVTDLARRPNVMAKLGGLGMDISVPVGSSNGNAPSSQLAVAWRPYIETCIEVFGAHRCMFESNFPVDSATCGYGALWNAFQLIAAACSADEKTSLFSGTALDTYRLDG